LPNNNVSIDRLCYKTQSEERRNTAANLVQGLVYETKAKVTEGTSKYVEAIETVFRRYTKEPGGNFSI
jgi:hypothetical protein